MSNRSKLRAAVRAAKSGREDAAGVELADMLAALLDEAAPATVTSVAAGKVPLSLEDRLEVVRIVGPQYLRTLTALGLTRAGRGAQPNGTTPTTGSPAGASADSASHERHRQRFSERRSG